MTTGSKTSLPIADFALRRGRKALALSTFVCLWAITYFALMPDPIAELRTGWVFIIVGFLGAVIGNLTAIGGGLIFIPVLIFGYHIAPVLALKTAIVSQAFGMTSGAFAWNAARKVPWHIVPWSLPGLVAGSTVSSLVIHPNAMLVKGLFGPVSILLGALLLLTVRSEQFGEPVWDKPARAAVVASSFVGGLLTGWVAIGEGEIVAATLMLGFGFASETAIALGVVLLSINSIYLAALHIGVLGGVSWNIAAFTVVGCVIGAQLAPVCAKYLKQSTLKIVFGIVAILDGMLFLYQFLLWVK
jgi:uncharacterized membrane protein YfcA